MQIARLSQTRLHRKKRPLKLCYYGEVVRQKGSMLRPERQFLQIGAECIGETNYLSDVEMMDLAYTSLNLVGIKKITIEISSRVFYDNFIKKINKLKNKKKIKSLIKLKDLKGLLKILDIKYHKYVKDLFACTGIYKDKKKNLQHLAVDNETINEINNIDNIVSKFLQRKKNINIFLDLCEVDDKNYHTGVRFTFFAQDVRGEIAKGGRYFVQHSNKINVATGFTCYMDTILRASSEKIIQKKIIVPFDISDINIKNIVSKGYSIIRYTGEFEMNRKLAKDYNCEFYFLKNHIKKV